MQNVAAHTVKAQMLGNFSFSTNLRPTASIHMAESCMDVNYKQNPLKFYSI